MDRISLCRFEIAGFQRKQSRKGCDLRPGTRGHPGDRLVVPLAGGVLVIDRLEARETIISPAMEMPIVPKAKTPAAIIPNIRSVWP